MTEQQPDTPKQPPQESPPAVPGSDGWRLPEPDPNLIGIIKRGYKSPKKSDLAR